MASPVLWIEGKMKMNHRNIPTRKRLLISVLMIMIAGGMYIGSYVSFRNHRIERGEHDKQAYVIFPKNRLIMYYIYRPLMYIDASLTGMQFHIGPHEDEGQEAQ